MIHWIATLFAFVPAELRLFLGVAVICCLLAVFAPEFTAKILRSAGRLFGRIARRKSLTIVVLFILVIALRLAVLPLLPVPIPGIHDEFSYLLMADTFVHGRLANPPHPMWISFESFHINWNPTYSSKYPPGQGAILALGQLLGNPWYGAVLNVAAMCAAILWMLQAWLPPRWALLGAALVTLKFGLSSYWINSYWGGGLVAAGAALVLGALPRILRRGRTRDALFLGLGFAILANTRPYEGVLFCIPVSVWFFWWLAGKSKNPPDPRTRFTRVFLPVAAILALTVLFIGYYNFRLTGNALLFPYTLNSRTYRTTGLFLWDQSKPPMQYQNPQFDDFYNGWEHEDYRHTWHDVWAVTAEKLTRFGNTYFWWGALLLLPGIPFAFRDRRMRLHIVILLLGAAGVFVLIWSMPHYAAPLTCVLFALMTQAVRHLSKMKIKRRPIGMALSAAAILLLALNVISNVAHGVCDPLHWPCEGDPSRKYVEDQLKQTPGKHLIMVRYSEDHNIHDEWVYNGAEIDSAKVLWARDLPGQNAKLFAYFKDRQIWLVEPDEDNTDIEPYTPPGQKKEP